MVARLSYLGVTFVVVEPGVVDWVAHAQVNSAMVVNTDKQAEGKHKL